MEIHWGSQLLVLLQFWDCLTWQFQQCIKIVSIIFENHRNLPSCRSPNSYHHILDDQILRFGYAKEKPTQNLVPRTAITPRQRGSEWGSGRKKEHTACKSLGLTCWKPWRGDKNRTILFDRNISLYNSVQRPLNQMKCKCRCMGTFKGRRKAQRWNPPRRAECNAWQSVQLDLTWLNYWLFWYSRMFFSSVFEKGSWHVLWALSTHFVSIPGWCLLVQKLVSSPGQEWSDNKWGIGWQDHDKPHPMESLKTISCVAPEMSGSTLQSCKAIKPSGISDGYEYSCQWCWFLHLCGHPLPSQWPSHDEVLTHLECHSFASSNFAQRVSDQWPL